MVDRRLSCTRVIRKLSSRLPCLNVAVFVMLSKRGKGSKRKQADFGDPHIRRVCVVFSGSQVVAKRRGDAPLSRQYKLSQLKSN